MIGMNLGHALTPMIGSFFVKAYGYEKMLVGFGLVLLIFGSLFLWLQYRKEKREEG